ncbi:Diphthine synthase [Pyrodictium delaneyi]|uniref:Diphthine synthase n=1 Tax=Pyrodictium delaneyi TaxID=1273541 RepID=A0A0P0N299_9CREN|nr:diphthine synthase [Pyrodictium delaneyi]ALL00727.1 Diphthine synthase [Pyrodictium delaneyi]
MALYIVGAGVSSEYLTLKAIQVIGAADKVYLDTYTSIAPGVDRELVRRLNPRAEVVEAPRRLLEDEAGKLIQEAREKTVVLLVPGDPLHATTHIALFIEARRRGVEAHVVPGVSGLQAVIDATGLQVYRFGKTVTLVYPEEGFKPYSTVETIWANRERGLHTLVLLDLRLDAGHAMTIPEAIRILLELEAELAAEEGREPEIRGAVVVGVARAGTSEQRCIAGTVEEVAAASYPPPPHSLVVAAPRLHPVEEEALEVLCGCKTCREKGKA